MTDTVFKAKGVVLWDIDGTLISPFQKNIESPHITALVKNGFNPQENYPKLNGSTDFEVIARLMSFYPSQENEGALKKCFHDLDNLSLSLYDSNSFSLCKGLPKALIKINELGWDNGILTGNTNLRMFKKLEALKLVDYFNKDFMFSCNLKDSRENITERAKNTLKSARYVNSLIVGDTPRDIKVAKKYNMKVVAVSSGNFSPAELEDFAPDLLIRNLEDDLKILLAFISNLGLKI